MAWFSRRKKRRRLKRSLRRALELVGLIEAIFALASFALMVWLYSVAYAREEPSVLVVLLLYVLTGLGAFAAARFFNRWWIIRSGLLPPDEVDLFLASGPRLPELCPKSWFEEDEDQSASSERTTNNRRRT